MSVIEKGKNIELVKIDGGTHRLEGSDVFKSIEILNTTMKALREFLIKVSKVDF